MLMGAIPNQPFFNTALLQKDLRASARNFGKAGDSKTKNTSALELFKTDFSDVLGTNYNPQSGGVPSVIATDQATQMPVPVASPVTQWMAGSQSIAGVNVTNKTLLMAGGGALVLLLLLTGK